VRHILEDVAEELEASCAEGALPCALSVDQVWVQPDGRAQILAASLVTDSPPDADGHGAAPQERALRLLRAVVVTALEGKPRAIADSGDRVRAPVPVHAADLLGRLFGGPRPYTSI